MSASKRFLRMMNPNNSHGGHHKHEGLVVKMVLVFAALFISLWFSNQTSVKLNSQINELEKERDLLVGKAKKLEITMTSMMSGEKLAEAAITRYGFKHPSSGQVIIVQRRNGIFGGILSREN